MNPWWHVLHQLHDLWAGPGPRGPRGSSEFGMIPPQVPSSTMTSSGGIFDGFYIVIWLVVLTPLKNISQLG